MPDGSRVLAAEGDGPNKDASSVVGACEAGVREVVDVSWFPRTESVEFSRDVFGAQFGALRTSSKS